MDADEPQQPQNPEDGAAKSVRFGAPPKRRYVPAHGYAPVTAPLGPLPEAMQPVEQAAIPTVEPPPAAPTPSPKPASEPPRFIIPEHLKKREKEPVKPLAARPVRPVRPAEVDTSILPVPEPGADLADPPLHWGWPVAVFLLTFVIYTALIPRFLNYSSPPTGDQPFYLMDTISLVEDHDLNLANNYIGRDEDKFYSLAPHSPDYLGMEAPYPLPPQLANTTARPQNEEYSFHLPGLPVLLIPSWVIGSWFSLWWPATVVFMCLLGSLLMLNIFLLAFQTTGKVWIAVAVWLPLAFSNPIMSFSYLIFTELVVGLFVIYAFRRLAMGWAANNPLRILFLGILIAYIPWLAWRCVILVVPLAVYAFVQWYRHYRLSNQPITATVNSKEPAAIATPASKEPLTRNIMPLVLFFVPLVISAIGIALFNSFLFGKLVPDTKVPELGDASPFHWPWQGLEQFQKTVFSSFALLFDRQNGLLTSAPIYILAIVGIIALARSPLKQNKRLLIWSFAIILPYAGVLASFVYWSGIWGPPARYLTSLVPLLAAPLAMSLYALRRSTIYLGLYALLALPGIAIMAIRMYDARLFWPANSVWDWLKQDPHSPLRIDIASILPAFDPLDDRYLPANTAWITVVSVAIVALGYFLMVRNRTARSYAPAPKQGSYALHAITWAVLLVVVAGGWYTTNFDALKSRTVFTEAGRWQSSYTLRNVGGMAYLNGSLYIGDYNPSPGGKGTVDKLDLSTGRFSPVQPTYQGQPNPFTNPDDVVLGPDGLLYVINNGPDDDFLYAMQADGTIVRKIALTGNSTLSAGMAFGPNNDLFVSDMPASRIIRYSYDGGKPLDSYTGETGGFNNTIGLTARDGKIYVAEMSGIRIQVLDGDTGQFLRDYKLKCLPQYIAIAPGEQDWMDIACGDGGIVSINTKTDTIQNARFANNITLDTVHSAVYGPDGTLYVTSGTQVIAFKVQH